ncbi:MAG: AGE family epimerase/isomerase [Pseudorhodobacter sp.]
MQEDPNPHRMADPAHRAALFADARRQLAFFAPSLRADGGFDLLDFDGRPLPRTAQALHTTARLVHSYTLGAAIGFAGAERIIDAGMGFLWSQHRDGVHGGYLWSVGPDGISDKLAYGHVFTLLAGSSAKIAGHPQADRLIADITDVIDTHFWDEEKGLLRDEFRRDWQVFSSYRGMNSNMHGAEAFMAAFEATAEAEYLSRAGRILDFFTARMAAAHGWRIPEHYTETWQVDPDYSGDPMFRPAGTTPGHSLEFARLILQHWDLSGRPENDAPRRARRLVERALSDGWRDDGGLVYTLDTTGRPAIRSRYWWPVTEALGAISALQKADPQKTDAIWYHRLWSHSERYLIDHDHGGWIHELDEAGNPAMRQFQGKPDIYHSLQATLLPLVSGLSRLPTALQSLRLNGQD